MIFVVASKRATAAACASALIVKLSSRRRRDIGRVKINQVLGRRDSVRIVASCASRLCGYDVFVVAGKTLVRQNTSAIMAFIAERVICVALYTEIVLRQLPFKQRRICRSVRTVWAAAACAWPLIVIVTVGAIDEARYRLWCE